MSLGDELKPHLPFLRRYARALTGSQTHGDNFVRATSRSRKKRPPAGEVGNALRSAYQRMVEEDIPPEMLDLLGKLG